MKTILFDGSDNTKLAEANGLIRELVSLLKSGEHAFEVKYDKGKSLTINFLGRCGEVQERQKKSELEQDAAILEKPTSEFMQQTIADQLDFPSEAPKIDAPADAGKPTKSKRSATES